MTRNVEWNYSFAVTLVGIHPWVAERVNVKLEGVRNFRGLKWIDEGRG
jgi:hypothetical protein